MRQVHPSSGCERRGESTCNSRGRPAGLEDLGLAQKAPLHAARSAERMAAYGELLSIALSVMHAFSRLYSYMCC